MYDERKYKMNLPTKLTVARIVLIPIFIALWYLPVLGPNELGSLKSIILTLSFSFLSITDWFDGYIARKYNLITDLGKFLDPIADKILVFSVYLLLLADGTVEPISLILMLSREFIVATVRMNAASENLVIAADKGGKLKTVVQMMSIIMLLLCMHTINTSLFYLTYGVYWLSVLLTIISGVSYVMQYLQFLNKKQVG